MKFKIEMVFSNRKEKKQFNEWFDTLPDTEKAKWYMALDDADQLLNKTVSGLTDKEGYQW